MNFQVSEALQVLERTPQTLEFFLLGLSDTWLNCNEGEGTWNVDEVIGHLIEGEKNDWIPRVDMILQFGKTKTFPPFDREAHLNQEIGQSLAEKLIEFKTLRLLNINKLKQLLKDDTDLELEGMHPAFGEVKLKELLSTWVVHDLTHISQISRVMANRYRTDVGPWIEYLGILNK